MAQKGFLTYSPQSGAGNSTVTVEGTEHTGRIARSGILKVTAANCEPIDVTILQKGTPEFVSSNSEQATAVKEGQLVTIEGISNSEKLTFTLGTGNLDVVLPSTYLANSVETANGVLITGDPGAQNAYSFSIKINVDLNDTIEEKTKQLIITDGASHTSIVLIRQAAGSARLEVSVASLEMDYLGTPVTFEVISNTSWSIS